MASRGRPGCGEDRSPGGARRRQPVPERPTSRPERGRLAVTPCARYGHRGVGQANYLRDTGVRVSIVPLLFLYYSSIVPLLLSVFPASAPCDFAPWRPMPSGVVLDDPSLANLQFRSLAAMPNAPRQAPWERHVFEPDRPASPGVEVDAHPDPCRSYGAWRRSMMACL